MEIPEIYAHRFWARVEKAADGCWLWRGYLCRGYGKFNFGGKKILAHRFSWLLDHEDIPEGKMILHRCDVRACVNPEHLYVGDASDNLTDLWSRGGRDRRNFNLLRCKKNPKPGAKLNVHDVAEIRRLSATGVPQIELAKRYRVTDGNICKIVSGQTWK